MKLSAQRINEISPYAVWETEEEGFVSFITDAGVLYSVGFDLSDIIVGYDSYQFSIVNVNHLKSPRDSKLKDTIMAILYDFFASNNEAMIYLCETEDEKQSMRSRLFQYWAISSDIKNEVTILSTCITDEEGIKNHASLILRVDHPFYNEILADFNRTVKLLNNKPKI